MIMNQIVFSLTLNIIIFFFFDKIVTIFNIKDFPDGKRKFHSKPIYLFGGTLILINLILFFILNILSVKNYTFDYSFNNREYFTLISGSILFYIFGLYDDKFKLKANYKLIISLFLVTFFLFIDNNLIIKELNFSFYKNTIELKTFSVYFTVLSFLLFINALNMFDGINLQSGFYILSIFVIFIIKGIFVQLSLILIIPLLLFLYMNYKNKIFFGESGIQLFAFLLAFIFIKTNNYQNNIFYADEIFIIMGIPGLDMFRLFLIRLLSGNHPFKPDTKHIHHLLNNFFSAKKTFLIIFSYIVLSIFLYSVFSNKLIYVICYILTYILIISLLNFNKKKK